MVNVTSFLDIQCNWTHDWVSRNIYMVARHNTIATILSKKDIPDYLYIQVFKANGVFLFERKLKNIKKVTFEKNDYFCISMLAGHDAMPLYSLTICII
jgi:hypothetical protein